MTEKQMALGLFVYPAGHHIAGWRHPDATWRGMEGFGPYRDIALAGENARYDFLFLADGLGVINPSSDNVSAYMPPISQFDPLMVNAALASVTSKIGLVATISTTFNEPYHIARKLASLDLISGGRSGWNIVTSISSMELARIHVGEIPPAETRYERADEFTQIVFDLWDSLDYGALPYDPDSGQVIDFGKVHTRAYEGKYFNIRGPLDVMKSPQGRPLIVQAGSSPAGIAFAARTADVVFSASPDKDMARAFYDKLKSAVAQAGRSPSSCLAMPGLMPIVGTSRQHAQDIRGGYESAINEQLAMVVLRRNFGDSVPADIDLSAPPPSILFTDNFSRMGILQEMARKENFTAFDLARSVSFARGHNVVTGTANDVADMMEDWVTSGCADGFNIMPASFMNGMNAFDQLVIPELQRRGLFKTEYHSSTTRGNLNLDRMEGSGAVR